MLIEWLGHSCFRISDQGYALVLDPYKPNMIPGLGPYQTEANQVLCSHEHADHNYRQVVNIIKNDARKSFGLSFIETFHDDEKGHKRGSNRITIIQTDTLRIAHFGDLGCELTESQYDALTDIDCVMIPVGGFYTIDAKTAKMICDRIKPKMIIPMHFKGDGFGPAVIDTVESFTKLYDKKQIRKYSTNHVDISEKTDFHIALLKLK